jgi:hypothetical protein
LHLTFIVCDSLKAYEKYYFGLKFVDVKGDDDWVKLEKKILKHIFPKVRSNLYDCFFLSSFFSVSDIIIFLYSSFFFERRDILQRC